MQLAPGIVLALVQRLIEHQLESSDVVIMGIEIVVVAMALAMSVAVVKPMLFVVFLCGEIN